MKKLSSFIFSDVDPSRKLMKKSFLTILLLSVLAGPVLADGVTFTKPSGGEVWGKKTQKMITYNFAKVSLGYFIDLYRNGVFVGHIAFHFAPVQYTVGIHNDPWVVGKITDDYDKTFYAAYGSGYTIRVMPDTSGPSGYSNSFTIGINIRFIKYIKEIRYAHLPKPDVCPQCIILDLTDLRTKLIKLDEPVTVGLFWKGKMVVNFGKIGKGRGFDRKLQIKLKPRVLATLKRGEKFELRLFTTGRNKQKLHYQAVRPIK